MTAGRIGGLIAAWIVYTVAGLELILQLATGNLGIPRFDIHPADGRCVGLSPGTSVKYTGWALRRPPVVHDVNRLGYRGEPRDPPKSAGVFRILIIGDSFTYGQGVAADQTMAAHLERELRQESGREIEVLNFGVPGFNLEENTGQYLKFASQWQHDLVLLAASDNDFGPPLCDEIAARTSAWLIKYVRLARLIWILVHPFGEIDASEGPLDQRLRTALNLFEQTSRAAGARFGLILVHGRIQGAPDGMAADIAAQRGLPCLLLDGSRSGFPSLPRLAGEFHFSSEGNREAAIRIARWLLENALLRAKG